MSVQITSVQMGAITFLHQPDFRGNTRERLQNQGRSRSGIGAREDPRKARPGFPHGPAADTPLRGARLPRACHPLDMF